MAIEDASPAAPPESAEVAGGTEQLRALLTGYAEVLETIDDAAPVLWARPERPPSCGGCDSRHPALWCVPLSCGISRAVSTP